MRATHISFMNDATEYLHAVSPFLEDVKTPERKVYIRFKPHSAPLRAKHTSRKSQENYIQSVSQLLLRHLFRMACAPHVGRTVLPYRSARFPVNQAGDFAC
jgi:hypothetical protein